VTALLVSVGIVLFIFGLVIWDFARPLRRSRDERRRASLGKADRHIETRWRDDE